MPAPTHNDRRRHHRHRSPRANRQRSKPSRSLPLGPYPEEEIERIKREVDLAELVRRSGVTLRRQGKDLIGLCPFHNDTSPSLVISPDKNLWHCLALAMTAAARSIG